MSKENGVDFKLIGTVVTSALFMLLFALVLWVAYIPNQQPPIGAQAKEDAEAQLREMKSEAMQMVMEYKVMDMEKGQVRIPVEKAMEMTVQEYSK